MNKFYVKCAIAALLVGISPAIYSQNVAVNSSGNPGNASTILDLSDPSNSTLGMLLTSVDIVNVTTSTPVSAPSAGLIVWNTNSPTVTAGGYGAGFYYWSGKQWVYLYNSATPLGTYILNQKTVQAGANFNIDDTGIIGGTLNVVGLSTLGAVTSTGAANLNNTGSGLVNIGSGAKASGIVEIGNNTGFTGINEGTPVSSLDINGSVGAQISAVALTGNTTLDNTYNTVLVDPNAATFTVTLPAAGPTNMRRYYTVLYAPAVVTTNAVTIMAASGSIYSGSKANATLSLVGGSMMLQSNGTNWYVVTDWGGGITPGTPWIITGNGGIIDGTNFLGTTDATPLNFGIKGNKAGRIDEVRDNTFIGYLSGSNVGPLTSGANNTGLGYNSVSTVTTGSNDVGVGSGALKSDNGGSNTALGYGTLGSNTSGTGNIGVGYLTLQNATIGSYNVGGGYMAMGAVTTGSYNIGIADSALNSNTTGYYNTAIGSKVLSSNTTGVAGVGLGYGALNSNLSGAGNVGLGYEPLYKNTTGAWNVGIGNSALYSNTTGAYNMGLGYDAMYSNTSGSYNAAVGANAMYGNTTGAYNDAVGYAAMYGNTTGSYNNAIGYEAGYTNTTGSYNNAFGYYAQYNNSGGASYNNAIGYEAGYTNSGYSYNNDMGYMAGYIAGGSNDNAIGYYSQYTNSGGSYNNSMGYYALYGISGNTGSYNNAVGYFAMAYNYTGGYNNAMGYYAMYENYSGSYNNAIGAFSLYNGSGFGSGSYNNVMGTNAMYYNLSGVHNNAIGYDALYTNTSGGYNNAMGYYALYSNTTGGRNIGIGYSALYANTAGSGNVAIGDSALSNMTSSYNTAIGYGAGASVATATNVTAIGNGAVAGASNTMVFGNHSVTGYEFNGALMPYYGAVYNPGVSGQILVSQGAGVAPQWGSAGTANNGLTFNAGVVQLGGPLIQNTLIAQTNFNLNVDLGTGAQVGTGEFMISNGGAGNTYLSVENSGNAGNPGQIGIGTNSPNGSAAIDVTSSTGGVLFPRMSTAQMNALPNPPNGLVVFNTSVNCLELYAGAWTSMVCGCTPPAAPSNIGGPQQFCAAASAQTYTCSPVAGANKYIWSISPSVAGTTLSSPTFTTTATATFAATPTTYTISVADSGLTSCLSGYSTYIVRVGAPAGTPATPVGSVSPLISTSQTYTIPVVAGYSYSWTSSNTNVGIVTSQAAGTATVTFGATAGTTNICVTASNNGCSGSPSCLTVVSSVCNLIHTTTTFSATGSIQTFTVGCGISSMTITANGGQGGSVNNGQYIGGYGAQMIGTFTVTPGEVLTILVGKAGVGTPNTTSAGGGGGGSYVLNNNNILIIAGGGGGRRDTGPVGTIANSMGNSLTNGQNSYDNSGAGGTGGNGGSSGEPNGSGTGGPGGGYTTNGGLDGSPSGGGPGFSYLNGSTPGAGCTSGTEVGGAGGYGGGGGGTFCYRGTAGGGGGYSGGGTGINDAGGGGGGSINNGANPINTTGGAPAGNGTVILQY